VNVDVDVDVDVDVVDPSRLFFFCKILAEGMNL